MLDNIDVLESIDFSKLPEQGFIRTLTIGMRMGGITVPFKLSNEKIQEGLREWRESNPEPKRPFEEKIVRRNDPQAKGLISRGYKGAWPAIVCVERLEAPEFDEAWASWQIEANWMVVSLAIIQSLKDSAGKLMETHEERIGLLKSKGMLDSHAARLAELIAETSPIEEGGADFGEDASEL